MILYIHQNQLWRKNVEKIWFDGQTSHFIIDEVGFCKIESEDQATTGKNIQKILRTNLCLFDIVTNTILF